MKKFVFFLSLMCVVNLSAQQEDTSPHYGMHLATGLGAQIALIASGITGAVVGTIAAAADVPSWLHRTLKIRPELPERFVTEDHRLVLVTLAAPAILGLIAGSWVLYKTPQWTDKYLLDRPERTRRQNVYTFLSRFLLPYPFGVLLGEYNYNKNRTSAAECSAPKDEVCDSDEVVSMQQS